MTVLCRISSTELRTVDKRGGLDEYLRKETEEGLEDMWAKFWWRKVRDATEVAAALKREELAV